MKVSDLFIGKFKSTVYTLAQKYFVNIHPSYHYIIPLITYNKTHDEILTNL
jgi:hypothetical protein